MSKFQFNLNLLCTDAKSLHLQLCVTPIDGSPPGSTVPGIPQARVLEWVAIPFSSAWKWKVKVKLFSCVRLCATPWTAAYQAPPSMGFSRQEYWSGVPLPSSLSHLHQIKKLILTVTRQVVLMYLLMAQHHFCDILAKNAQPHVVMRKNQTDPCWRTLYKISGLNPSNMLRSWKQKTYWETAIDWRRLRRHGN